MTRKRCRPGRLAVVGVVLAGALGVTPSATAQCDEMNVGQNAAFGRIVVADGGLVAIARHGDDENGPLAGAAYLFDLETGEELSKIKPDVGTDNEEFGYFMDLDGDYLVVGTKRGGAAYVFDVTDPTSPKQLHKLEPSGSTWLQEVAVSGDVVLAAAPFEGGYQGKVDVIDAATGVLIRELVAEDGGPDQRFGQRVAIDGTTAVISAKLGAGDSLGVVYIFDASTGEQLHRIEETRHAGMDYFGQDVDICGNVMMAGTLGGKVAFLYDATTGEMLRMLEPFDGASYGQRFGQTVGLRKDVCIVGAPHDTEKGQFGGSAYLFDVSTGELICKMLPPDAKGYFGLGVDVLNDAALAGAPWINNYRGTVYAFRPTCYPDLDRNCDVGFSDLLLVLAAWGGCDGHCPADLDHSDEVDFGDILTILANWGPCPVEGG